MGQGTLQDQLAAPNFAHTIKKAKAANATAEETQGKMAPQVIELLIRSDNNVGAMQIQSSLAFVLNFLGAEKKQSMAPKQSQERKVEEHARQMGKWITGGNLQ